MSITRFDLADLTETQMKRLHHYLTTANMAMATVPAPPWWQRRARRRAHALAMLAAFDAIVATDGRT